MQLHHSILKRCNRADCLNFGSEASSANVVSMCQQFDTNEGPQAVSMTVEYGNVNPKRFYSFDWRFQSQHRLQHFAQLRFRPTQR
uniref:Protein Wnt n=1 Tax=Panagrellus redivivus TaxID=6233 RepID=A0A7E4UUS5_PANRE